MVRINKEQAGSKVYIETGTDGPPQGAAAAEEIEMASGEFAL